MKITVRDVPPRSAWALEQAGVHPLLARLFAARGVHDAADLDADLKHLIDPAQMHQAREAACLLADALQGGRSICVVADYDCDGATACAVALRGLGLLSQTLGHRAVSYLVPDRVVDGYGLTAAIAERVKARGADVLVTVDNGIASLEGVARARELGLQVLITDHHLPAQVDGRIVLPEADVIVNPNQPACSFPSKSIAGVGVMFYVLLALRAELRERGVYAGIDQPRLDSLLPLVALGTVADVVRLDSNNRRLVAQGLRRMRAGQMPAGLAALMQVAGRKTQSVSSLDFGFAVGPRINAAGRLSDMTLGIECLLTDDISRAQSLAAELDRINRQRRDLEGQMREQAMEAADAMSGQNKESPPAVVLFDPQFHEGVVGIVASRVKDRLHRPCFVFAASGAEGKAHELKGSGRSIPGFHLRDALDLVAKRHPGVLLRFGGHAMAAGCTVPADQLETFRQALAQVAREWLDEATLTRQVQTDGPLPAQYRRADVVETLQQQVWGQGFAAPTFCEPLQVISQRRVGQGHLSLKLRHQGQDVEGIWFGRTEPLPETARLVYRLDLDEWQGQRRVRFVIEAGEA